MEIKELQLDKLTIVGNLKKDLESSFQLVLNNSLHVNILDSATSFVKGNFFNSFEDSVYFEYDGVNSSAMKKRNFRLEFNPAKILKDQSVFIKKYIMPLLSDVAFSRLDLALDINVRLSTFNFEIFGLTKTQIYSKDGSLSTLYIGSRQSNRMIRVYDKKRQLYEVVKEDISDEILWRLEFELKGSSYIDKLIRDGFDTIIDFRIIDYDYSSLTASDEIFISSMYLNPDAFSRLSKPTKSRYRKIAKSLPGIDLSIEFKKNIQKNNPLILDELKGYQANALNGL